jgi:hypothetical protein
MEELRENLRGTEDLHGSGSLRMSSDSLDFPAVKPTRSSSNNFQFVEPKHFLSTVSLTRLDLEPLLTPDLFSTLSCPDLMFEIVNAPQPFHLRVPSTDQKFDSQETLKADDDEDFEPSRRPFFLGYESDSEEFTQTFTKVTSLDDCSLSSSTTYMTCSETSLVSARGSRPTSFAQSEDSMHTAKDGSSCSSLAYFTPLENTPVSSNCPSPVPRVSSQRKLLRISMEKVRRQMEAPSKSSSTPSSPVPTPSEADQQCHTLPRAAKKHRSPSPPVPYYDGRANQFSVEASSLFPLEPRTLNLSSLPSQLHTADSYEELQEFLLLESQCVVEKRDRHD